nr:reverse transcriptase domain-containing protein [Tanacetum cinerariifolium]
MADQRTMAELLRTPSEGYAEAIVVPPIIAERFELKHSLINMMTSDQFFALEKDNPHDHIHSQTYSFSKSANGALTTAMTAILKQFQATPHPASVKACLAADGNTFLEFWDNIQGYVSAVAVNYNQVVPLSELEKIKMMNEINIKATQTQINNVKNELRYEMKTSIQASMSNQTNELKNMMASFFQMNTASISSLGPLPSNTIANPKEETLTDPKLAEYTLKVPHPLVQKAKPPSQRNNVMVKALLSNKENLLELANTPSMKIAQRELKCKALANLGASINLMPISVWKKLVINPLSGNTTPSSPDHLLEEFTDELALIVFPLGNDDLPIDIEFDLREIEYLLNYDPTKEMDSILEDSVDECNLADPNNNLVDTIPEMFIDEHTLDYSFPPLYDDVDDLDELESDNDNVYDDPFDSKEYKIKESKLLIDELDPPRSSDFLLSLKYDSVLYENVSEVDALPSTNNEDKVFNLGILIHENFFEATIHVTPDKNVKKISISNASLILEDFNPHLYELPFHKEDP